MRLLAVAESKPPHLRASTHKARLEEEREMADGSPVSARDKFKQMEASGGGGGGGGGTPGSPGKKKESSVAAKIAARKKAEFH